MRCAWVVLFCLFAGICGAAEGGRVFDPNEIVGRVDNGSFFLHKMATAWCLDENCSVLVTNYHSVAIIGSHMIFHGVKVADRVVATGPDDAGAMWLDHLSGARLKYNPAKDLALLKMSAPLAGPGVRNVEFRAEPLKRGEKATVYACPKGRCLKEVQLEFVEEMENNLLLFKFADAKELAQGASGGLIVDSENRAVGILRGLQGNLAIAVPSRTLMDFVKNVEPKLYAKIKPKEPEKFEVGALEPIGISVSPELPDQYLTYDDDSIQTPPAKSGAIRLKSRDEKEPQAILELRQKAQSMIEQMDNLAAVQSLLLSGKDEKHTLRWKHLVKVTEGKQVFREWPDGKEDIKELPFPEHGGIAPGGEWSSFPGMVGNDLRLHVEQADDIVVNGRQLKVFRFHGNEETKACSMRISVRTFFGDKVYSPPIDCTGDVWTDDALNILRISQTQRVYLGKGRVTHGKTVVHYGWLRDEQSGSRLLPARIHMWFDLGERWTCDGEFNQYQILSRPSTVKANTMESSANRQPSYETSLLAGEQRQNVLNTK